MALELEGHKLTIGGRYLVLSAGGDEPIVTLGAFRGFSALGEETALVIEMESEIPERRGRLRLIPVAQVLAAEVLELKDQEKGSEPLYYL